MKRQVQDMKGRGAQTVRWPMVPTALKPVRTPSVPNLKCLAASVAILQTRQGRRDGISSASLLSPDAQRNRDQGHGRQDGSRTE